MIDKRALIIAPNYLNPRFSNLLGKNRLVSEIQHLLGEWGEFSIESYTGSITKDKFRTYVDSLASGSEQVLFYFYGHGLPNGSTNTFLVTSNADPNDEGILLSEIIDKLVCSNTSKIIIVLDCCYSGLGSRKLREVFERMAIPASGISERQIAFFASSLGDQRSWETTDTMYGRMGHFSATFLRGLKSGALRNGEVTTNVLADYISGLHQDWRQKPICLGGWGKHVIIKMPIPKDQTSTRNKHDCEQPQNVKAIPILRAASSSDLEPFLMDEYPVTNRRYLHYVKSTKATPPKHWFMGRFPAGLDEHPVVNVTWEQANRFANWAGGKLPNLEQWRLAAYGLDDFAYPTGDSFQEIHGNTLLNRRHMTSPVSEFSAGESANHVRDLLGNVWEWTRDVEMVKKKAIIVGGSFRTLPEDVQYGRYLQKSITFFGDDIGFRCVYEP